MEFAGDVTDKRHLPPGCNTDCSGCTAPIVCGPRTYEQRLRVQRNRLSATYTGTGVTYVSGPTPNNKSFLQLNDGGNPSAIVQYTIPDQYTLVNKPVYKVPPSNPVTSTNKTQAIAGPLFNVTVNSASCCVLSCPTTAPTMTLLAGANRIIIQSLDNGVTWTQISTTATPPYPFALYWDSINSLWLSGGNSIVITPGVPISSSPVGTTWTAGTGIPLNDIIYDINSNGTILAAASSPFNGNYVYTSTDGQVWTDIPIPSGTDIYGTYSVVWDETSTWLITTTKTTNQIAFQGGIFTSSDNFVTLVDRGNNKSQSMRSLQRSVFDGTQWIVGGFHSVSTDGSILYSTMVSDTSWISTGWNWTFATGDVFDGVNGACNDITFNGTVYVAVGSSFDRSYSISYSTDGRSWTRANNTFTGAGNNVTWATDRFVAIGVDFPGSGLVTPKWSIDGITWTNSTGAQLPNTGFLGYGLSRNQRIGM